MHQSIKSIINSISVVGSMLLLSILIAHLMPCSSPSSPSTAVGAMTLTLNTHEEASRHKRSPSPSASAAAAAASLSPEMTARLNFLLRGYVDKRAGYGVADYGHMRFGKRAEGGGAPNFYGHMRFGKRTPPSSDSLSASAHSKSGDNSEWYFPNRDFDELELEQATW